MSFYHRALELTAAPESAVDCSRCVAQYKCCTYRPFVANFLAGGIVSLPKESWNLEEWDLLGVGLAPAISYRRYFLKRGKWGFGEDKKLLCAFYEAGSGNCKVWQHRPSVCRTFFCKSSYADQGMTYWQKAEEFFWRLEWVLLEDFLFEKGWTLDEIALSKKYLHEDYMKSPFELPRELRFDSVDLAESFYKEAWTYISNRSEDQVLEVLGGEGHQLYRELLAHREKIR